MEDQTEQAGWIQQLTGLDDATAIIILVAVIVVFVLALVAWGFFKEVKKK